MAKSKSCKWHSIDESQPEHGKEVLIKCDDGFYVAKFDKYKEGFLLRGNALLTEQVCTIHWMEINFP